MDDPVSKVKEFLLPPPSLEFFFFVVLKLDVSGHELCQGDPNFWDGIIRKFVEMLQE